jgi:hypothetical protein
MFDKRTVFNTNFFYERSYFWIDFYRLTGAYIPTAANMPGPFVFTWTGTATLQGYTGTWTTDEDLSSAHTFTSPDKWAATDGYIVATRTSGSAIAGDNAPSFSSGSGANIHAYLLEDEEDYLAGRVFRRAALAALVDLNPGCIRFMNWSGYSGNLLMRAEHRSTPAETKWSGRTSLVQLTYGNATGTNQWSVDAVSGTPVEYQHGEIVECVTTTGMARGNEVTITAVTKGVNPTVTYSGTDRFIDGDVITFRAASGGMVEIDYQIGTVASLDTGTKTFTLSGVDSTSYSNWTTGYAAQYISLNVGGRGAAPVVYPNGQDPASRYGSSGVIGAGTRKAYYYDKNLAALKDSNGDWVYGAWMFDPDSGFLSHVAGVPWEICTKFVTELVELMDEWNAANPSLPPKGPTHIWMCVPPRGVLSMDPDYTEASNVAIQMVDIVLNGDGGSWQGLKAFNAGRPASKQVQLILENGNEDWNEQPTVFPGTAYYTRLGQLRWSNGAPGGGVNSYSSLRSIIMTQDIRAAFPNDLDMIKFFRGGQGTTAYEVGNKNYERINGTAALLSDALFIAQGGGDPMDYHDIFGIATYWFTGTANLTADAATYAAATTDADREAACQLYVDDLYGSGTGETIGRYITIMQELAAEMESRGKIFCNYEGGMEQAISGTAEVQAYIRAVKRSKALALANRRYLSAVKETDAAYLPALPYLMTSSGATTERWTEVYPDTFGSGTVEGGDFSLTWDEISDHNNGRRGIRLVTS